MPGVVGLPGGLRPEQARPLPSRSLSLPAWFPGNRLVTHSPLSQMILLLQSARADLGSLPLRALAVQSTARPGRLPAGTAPRLGLPDLPLSAFEPCSAPSRRM